VVVVAVAVASAAGAGGGLRIILIIIDAAGVVVGGCLCARLGRCGCCCLCYCCCLCCCLGPGLITGVESVVGGQSTPAAVRMTSCVHNGCDDSTRHPQRKLRPHLLNDLHRLLLHLGGGLRRLRFAVHEPPQVKAGAPDYDRHFAALRFGLVGGWVGGWVDGDSDSSGCAWIAVRAGVKMLPMHQTSSRAHVQDVLCRLPPPHVKVARRELGRWRQDVDQMVADALPLRLGELWVWKVWVWGRRRRSRRWSNHTLPPAAGTASRPTATQNSAYLV